MTTVATDKKPNRIPSKSAMPSSFIQLGKMGDIMIVLRALRIWYERTGVKPRLIVAQDFSRLLEGVSYIERHTVPFHWWKGLGTARSYAETQFGAEATVIQCRGDSWSIDESQWPCFHVSMWDRAGVPLSEIRTAPLVFDLRNYERESQIAAQFIAHGRPTLLYNFEGISSPLKAAADIKTELNQYRDRYQLVNLGPIRTPFLFDLLGLYDRAAVLVTSDTSTLHLAAASKVPVIAYTQDGWGSSIPAQNCICEIKYREAGQSMERLREALRSPGSVPANQPPIVLPARPGKIYHCFTAYQPKDADTRRRNTVAQRTWKDQPWIEVPIKDADLPRMFREDGRAWPYIKDLFDLATKDRDPEDIVVYTNADIHVRSDTCRQIREAMKTSQAIYGYRRDFVRLLRPLRDAEYERGENYCGSDIKAFRVGWWRANRDQMADMVLGGEAWDPMIRLLIDQTNPASRNSIPNLIGHERHASFWEAAENRYRLEMQKHCLRTAHAWFTARGVDPASHGIKLP